MCRDLINIKNAAQDNLTLKFEDENVKSIPPGLSARKLTFDVKDIFIGAGKSVKNGKKFSFNQGGKNIESEDDGKNPRLSLEIENKEKSNVDLLIKYNDESTNIQNKYETKCFIDSIAATMGAKATKLTKNGNKWEGTPNTINIIAKELRENR